MGTVIATGASSIANTPTAINEAVRSAQARLGKARTEFGFVFAGPGHKLALALRTTAEMTGCDHLVGSSTAGEFTAAGLTHGGVTVMLVSSDEMTPRTAFSTGLSSDPNRVAADLYKEIPDARLRAAAIDRRRLTTVLLTDGLAGKGEDLVLKLHELGQSAAPIIGGAAGDEGAFRTTVVGCGREVASNAATALHVFSTKPWGVGMAHGLRPTTKPVRVTKASGNIVIEINNAPAFEIYKAHAAQRNVKLTPASATAYMIANELGIHFFDRISRARAPLSVGPDGSLICAAAIPEGAMVSILDGEPASMLEAAKLAAEEARNRLEGGKVAGVLIFDCVCRGMILKDAFQREVDAVCSVFGDAPVAGFLTYGEIARYPGSLDGWHNATVVVAAIPA